MFVTFDFPFANDMAEVAGYYTPYSPGCNYLANGDPGYPETLPEFELHSFSIRDVDISLELDWMYVKKNVYMMKYLDSISSLLLEYAMGAYDREREDMILPA